jgi:mannose-6-phosphate isomerase-like protein (cupin superfamily)
MLKTNKELRRELIESLRGGKGTCELIHLMEKEQFSNKGRLFVHFKLKPGCSVGYHKHEGDFEGYYFLKGEGTYNEDEKDYPVKAGDFTFVEEGHSHGIENTGTEDLEFIALVLFAN